MIVLKKHAIPRNSVLISGSGFGKVISRMAPHTKNASILKSQLSTLTKKIAPVKKMKYISLK